MNIKLHTPGPWHVGSQQRIESLANGQGGCLLVISERGVSGRSWEEAQANAVLIAKAPELLAQRDELIRDMNALVAEKWTALKQRDDLRQALKELLDVTLEPHRPSGHAAIWAKSKFLKARQVLETTNTP